MLWTKEKKILILRQNHSKLCAQQNFTGSLTLTTIPRKAKFIIGYTNFRATGSVNNLKKKAENSRFDRKLTAICLDNVDAVRDSAGSSSKTSLRRHSQELGLSRASLQRILKNDLLQYPYRIQIKHKLTPADMEFFVSVINHYHINGLYLFWNTLLYIFPLQLWSRADKVSSALVRQLV